MNPAATIELDAAIEAYEETRARDPAGATDLRRFAPDPGHPSYAAIVIELVRVDMEHTWSPDDAHRLTRYRALFPDVFDRAESWSAVAYEEYRLRTLSGERVDPREYQRRFGCDVRGWAPQASPLESPPWSRPRPAGRDPGSTRADAEIANPQTKIRSEGSFPNLGDTIWGFELVDVLGAGAFARVYLARQTGLADRLVALKVFLGDSNEPRQMAQLQHTNIMPIYSQHRKGPLAAVCMPYLGRSTLADVLAPVHGPDQLPLSGQDLITTLAARGEQTQFSPSCGEPLVIHAPDSAPARQRQPWADIADRSYVGSMVWIMLRIAEGLEHAHQRGIIHRDLKPANLLLSDDGQPLILDFNISVSPTSSAPTAGQGGTLPYMAPEQLAAFRGGGTVDQRGDLYSLGVILYQSLTGQLPFPRRGGTADDDIQAAIEDRRGGWPSARALNPIVSPGLDSIVRKCLAFAPDERYASARELSDDLKRHLDDRPLRYAADPSWCERVGKWCRRNRGLASNTTVGIATVILLSLAAAGWWLRGQSLAAHEAARQLRVVSTELPILWTAVDPGVLDGETRAEFIERAARVCREYGVGDDPRWSQRPSVTLLDDPDRARLFDALRTILFLRAEMRLSDARGADAARRETALREAFQLNRLLRDDPALCGPSRAVDQQEKAIEAARRASLEGRSSGDISEAVGSVSEPAVLGELDARLNASRLLAERQYAAALSELTLFAQAQPDDFALLLQLAITHRGLRHQAEAEGFFTACIALRPDLHIGWMLRGLLRLENQQFAAAQEDFDQALRIRPSSPSLLVNRALAARGLGRHEEAIRDLEQALQRGAAETRILLLLAQSYREMGNQARSDQLRREWMSLEPTDELSWVTRGVGKIATDPRGARDDFQAALRLNPSSTAALQNLAHVLSERLDQTAEAIDVLGQSLRFDPDNPVVLGSRAVLEARLGQRDVALADTARALALGKEQGFTWYQAGCVYALVAQSDQGGEWRTKALACLNQAIALDPSYSQAFSTDRDLESLWASADFKQLLVAGQRSAAARRAATELVPSTPANPRIHTTSGNRPR